VSDITKIFKALANENRLNILRLLLENNCVCEDAPPTFNPRDLPEGCLCVQEIVEKFNMTQATISHHLRELSNAGLLTRHKVGPWVYYLVNYETIEEIKRFFGEIKPSPICKC
jgi:DNA-binding transcriptional ArsR family regulator